MPDSQPTKKALSDLFVRIRKKNHPTLLFILIVSSFKKWKKKIKVNQIIFFFLLQFYTHYNRCAHSKIKSERMVKLNDFFLLLLLTEEVET